MKGTLLCILRVGKINSPARLCDTEVYQPPQFQSSAPFASHVVFSPAGKKISAYHIGPRKLCRLFARQPPLPRRPFRRAQSAGRLPRNPAARRHVAPQPRPRNVPQTSRQNRRPPLRTVRGEVRRVRLARVAEDARPHLRRVQLRFLPGALRSLLSLLPVSERALTSRACLPTTGKMHRVRRRRRGRRILLRPVHNARARPRRVPESRQYRHGEDRPRLRAEEVQALVSKNLRVYFFYKSNFCNNSTPPVPPA